MYYYEQKAKFDELSPHFDVKERYDIADKTLFNFN